MVILISVIMQQKIYPAAAGPLPAVIPQLNGSTVIFDPSSTDAVQVVTVATTCTSCSHMLIIVRSLTLSGLPKFFFNGSAVLNLTLWISSCIITKDSTDSLISISSTMNDMSNFSLIIDATSLEQRSQDATALKVVAFAAKKVTSSSIHFYNVTMNVTTNISSTVVSYANDQQDMTVVVENSNITIACGDAGLAKFFSFATTAGKPLIRARFSILNTTMSLSGGGVNIISLDLYQSFGQELAFLFDLTNVTIRGVGAFGGGLVLVTLPRLPLVLQGLVVGVSRSTWIILPPGALSRGVQMIAFAGDSSGSSNGSTVVDASIVLRSSVMFQTPQSFISDSSVTTSRTLGFLSAQLVNGAILIEDVVVENLRTGFYLGRAYYGGNVSNVTVVVMRTVMYVMTYAVGFNGGMKIQNVTVVVLDSSLTTVLGGPSIDVEDFVRGVCGNISVSVVRSSCISAPSATSGDTGVPSCANLEHLREASNIVYHFADSNLTGSQNSTSPFTNVGVAFVTMNDFSIVIERCSLTIYLNSNFVIAATNINIFQSTISRMSVILSNSSVRVRQEGQAIIFAGSLVLVDSCPVANFVSVVLSNVTGSIDAMTIAAVAFQGSNMYDASLKVQRCAFALTMLWALFPLKPLKSFYGEGFFTLRSSTASSADLSKVPVSQIWQKMPIGVYVNLSLVVDLLRVEVVDSSVTLTPLTTAEEVLLLAVVENTSLSNAVFTVRNVSHTAWTFFHLDNATVTNLTVSASDITSLGSLKYIVFIQSILSRTMTMARISCSRFNASSMANVKSFLSIDSGVKIVSSSISLDHLVAVVPGPSTIVGIALSQAVLEKSTLALSFFDASVVFSAVMCVLEPCVVKSSFMSINNLRFPVPPIGAEVSDTVFFAVTKLQFLKNVTILLDQNVLNGFSSLFRETAMWEGSSLTLRVHCNLWNAKWLTADVMQDVPADKLQLLGYTNAIGAFPFNKPHCPTAASGSQTATASQTATVTSTLRIYSPPARQHGAAAASSTAATVLLSSVLPGSAIAVQRGQTQAALALCQLSLTDPLDVFSSPTQLYIGPAEGGYLRGAVVGNIVVIWCGCALIAFGLAAFLIRVWRRSMWDRAGHLSLPGRLIVPYTMLVVPTISAALSLLLNGPTGGDQLLGIAGLAASGAPWAVVVCLTTIRFQARPIVAATSRPRNVLDFAAQLIFGAHTEWVNAVPHSGFVEHFSQVFEPYRRGRHWYIGVEVTVAVVFGILGGAFVDDGATCKVLLVIATVVNAAVLLTLILRPYDTQMDMIMATVNAVLNLVTGVYGLIGRDPTAIITSQAYANNVAIALLIAQLIAKGYLRRCIERIRQLIGLDPVRRRRARGEMDRSHVQPKKSQSAQERFEDDERWNELRLKCEGHVRQLNRLIVEQSSLSSAPSCNRSALELVVKLVCGNAMLANYEQGHA